MEKKQAFIVGCGYVGHRLARRLNADHALYGLVRTTKKLKTLRAVRVEPIVLDLDTLTARDLASVWYRDSAIFYLAPPPGEGESEMRLHRFLNALKARPRVFVYFSTTGVYGNLHGEHADESRPVAPQTDRARRRVSGEHISRIWCNENSVRRVVLRVPAIYGAGRLPLDKLRRGDPVLHDSEAPIVNRIHVEDLVQICAAVAHNEDARGVYNVGDGNHLTLTAYLNLLADLAHLPSPPQLGFEEAQFTMNPEYLSYWAESRRVVNDRITKELGITLKYGDLTAGLRASLEEEAAHAARRKAKIPAKTPGTSD